MFLVLLVSFVVLNLLAVFTDGRIRTKNDDTIRRHTYNVPGLNIANNYGLKTGQQRDIRQSIKDQPRLDNIVYTRNGSRTKRIVFLPDTRLRVNASIKTQQLPFSAAVKISTGCSGSLISQYHVLTAAHCLHNGTRYITSASLLRVGLLRRNNKFRWYNVLSFYIPGEWLSNHNTPRYDYAVIKLTKPTRRKYFHIGVVSGLPDIHFNSFPGDKPSNTMWYSSCRARVLRYRIVSRCDAAKGSSGAGLYVNHPKHHRVLVGVLSGAEALRLSLGRKMHLNVAFRITRQSEKRICKWIGSPTRCV